MFFFTLKIYKKAFLILLLLVVQEAIFKKKQNLRNVFFELFTNFLFFFKKPPS